MRKCWIAWYSLVCERKAKPQPSSRRRITGKNLSHNLSHTVQAQGALSVSAVRVAGQNMENKTNGRMSTINTTIADSTETIVVSDLIEAGYSNSKLSNESQSLTCMSSVRNFGNVAGTVIHGLNSSGDGAVFKDCNTLDDSSVAKHFYDHSGGYLKGDNVPWEEFVNVQGTIVASSEILPDGSLSLASTTRACKFIKDEKETSVIMDTACPNFDPSSDIPALDNCCDTDRKQQQQLGLSDGDSTSFTLTTAGHRPGLDGSPNFLIDLNQSDQLQALGQVRTDPRKAATNFDASRHTALPLAMYKTDVPRWQTQTSPAEPQYWCQPPGETQDPFVHSSYNGIQSQAVVQRNPSPFSSFPG